jgi:NAD(P)-dependent dehydrogenase (short-subunit alcohol dehydrogenase family)
VPAATTVDGRVALVTGASRGWIVYVTGRSALGETARLGEGRPGCVIAAACDHRDDEAVAAVFETVARERGRLDLLVSNATALPDLGFLFSDEPFWSLQADAWDDLMVVGLRSHFIAAQHAARLMIQQGNGLIVNI